jgi:PAS domain S-box-containing protein
MGDHDKIFNVSIDMLCIADASGYFLDVNSAFTRTLGYGREELLAQPFLNFVHPDDQNPTEAELQDATAGQQHVQFENRYRHKDGHYRTLSWSSITDEETGQIYAVARDVTEQVNLRNRLLRMERALEKGMLVAVADRDGNIVSVNERFCVATGHANEEVAGRPYHAFISGQQSSDFLDQAGETILAGRIWSGAVSLVKKDGGHCVVHTLISPMLDHEGVITSYFSVSQDMTASIQNEEALARTVEILSETNAIAKVGGWELEVATGDLNWTDETFRILEVEKKAGRKPILPEGLSLFTPRCQPIIERAVSRAIEFGEPYSLELEAQTAKGNVLWVYTNGKANYRDGKVITLSGTIQDIQARKTAELRYEAEHRRVIHDAKMASLGELAASMAHELNNPLGIAAGYAELALQSPEVTPKLQEKLERIAKSCERMAHIVSNLRRFSRPEHEPRARAPHLLTKIIEEAIALVDSRLKNERVEVCFESESKRTILCSEIEIEQVLVNLLNNSIEAMRGLPTKKISIEVSERSGEVDVRVVDSGSGIPAKHREELFSPFFTTKGGSGEGTGLGLAISREIVEDHDARLVYDEESTNTCFVITFPSRKDAAHDA